MDTPYQSVSLAHPILNDTKPTEKKSACFAFMLAGGRASFQVDEPFVHIQHAPSPNQQNKSQKHKQDINGTRALDARYQWICFTLILAGGKRAGGSRLWRLTIAATVDIVVVVMLAQKATSAPAPYRHQAGSTKVRSTSKTSTAPGPGMRDVSAYALLLFWPGARASV
ncbi:hypothetical protein MKZ38_008722 [Zalerion maritima]|uniref:Uncharacterized protein n=1 Tax=Zalerion maritima TaxID=339359 RepID=A0AAD5RVQ9_9PEZI|nr:hypothetical protein MKZ38_008722 [Zalerion maritima]